MKLLENLWFSWGVGLLYFSINAWLASVGAGINLPGIEFPDKYKAAIYGSFIIFLLGYPVFVFIGVLFCRRAKTTMEAHRYPIGALHPTIRRAIFLAMLFVPVFVGVHLAYQILTERVFLKNVESPVVSSIGEMLFCPRPVAVIFTDQFRFGDPASGVTFFPFWEPWLLCVLILLNTIFLVIYLRSLVFDG